MFRYAFATCLCLIFLFWAGAGSFSATNAAEEPLFRPLPQSLPVPPLIVQSPPDAPVPLAALIGKLLAGKKGVFLVLWTPSCPICQAELPDLDKAAARLQKAGYALLPLAEDTDGLATVPSFRRRYEIKNLKLYIDRQERAQTLLPLRGLPTTFLIDAGGNVASVREGRTEWERLPLDRL